MQLTSERLSSSQRWVLALTSLASFMIALDGLVVTTALTTIRHDLDASIGELEWTINAFTLSFAVLIMTAAALGDRFGHRLMFASGIALFGLASTACALAPDAGTLIAARAVQGIGAALISPLALALLSAAIPPARRGFALGIFSSAIGLGVLLGPVVGGAITEGIAWQWIFWLNVPVCAIVFVVVLRRIPAGQAWGAKFDRLGLALISGGVLGIVWALVRGNSVGWGSAEVSATAGPGLVLLVLFVAWERGAREPMLPPRLFALRDVAAGDAVSFFLFAGNFASVYFLAQYEQEVLGYGALAAGVGLLPLTIPLFLGAARAGALADRIGVRPLVETGLVMLAGAAASVAVIAQGGLAYRSLVVPLVIAGLGTALAMPAAQKAVVSAVEPRDIGKASGTFMTMRWLGGVFGIAVGVAVFAATGSYDSPSEFSDGFIAAMIAIAVFSLCGAIAGTALTRRRSSVHEADAPTTGAPDAIIAEGDDSQ
jgi:EmrB/QacA subfamily drug resistance transporter